MVEMKRFEMVFPLVLVPRGMQEQTWVRFLKKTRRVDKETVLIVGDVSMLFILLFFFIYVGVRASLRAPQLIPRFTEHPTNPVDI